MYLFGTDKESDDDLLSQADAYYHWRGSVSPSCSGWEGVVPLCYGRQTKGWGSRFFLDPAFELSGVPSILRSWADCFNHAGFSRRAGRRFGWVETVRKHTPLCIKYSASQNYRIKPHGQLVRVSLTHYCASTPRLSTLWSSTTLQCTQGARDILSSGKFHA